MHHINQNLKVRWGLELNANVEWLLQWSKQNFLVLNIEKMQSIMLPLEHYPISHDIGHNNAVL